MLANYRLSAELTAIETTTDGRCIVIGTLDGCLSVLAIADPSVAGSYQFLATLPSRTRQVRVLSQDGGGSFDRNGGHSDEESVDNKKKKKKSREGDEDGEDRSHVSLKTAAVVAAAWAKTSQDGVQKVTSKACVIS